MCPNHVEPIAEEKLLTSSSYCERVKLWNHFSKPIDHETIKISFLEKVHEDCVRQSSERETSAGGDPGKVGTLELTKLGCRVPMRVKREYEKYIREIEQYEGESGSEDELMMRNESRNDRLTSARDLISKQIPSCSSITSGYQEVDRLGLGSHQISHSDEQCVQTQHIPSRRHKDYESLLDIALKYMIESSKVLELTENQRKQQSNRTSDKNQHHFNINGVDDSLT